MLPSSRWWFSTIAMIVRPTATAVPLSVCTWRGDPPSAGRKRMSSLRDWKSVVFEHDVSLPEALLARQPRLQVVLLGR